MSFFSSPKKRASRSALSRRQGKRTPFLRLELLEDRSCPTGSSIAPSRYVGGLFFDFLHRMPTQAEQNAWVSIVQSASSPLQVTQIITGSTEFLQDQAQALYQNVWGQAPSAATLSGLVTQLRQDAGNAQYLEYLQVSSPAYFQSHAGSNIQTWLADIYPVLLGRSIDNAGLSGWLAAYANHASRQSIAAAVAFGREGLQYEVQQAYYAILGRQPAGADITTWSNLLRSGLTQDQLMDQLAASAEFQQIFAAADLPVANSPAYVADANLTNANLVASNYYETASAPFQISTNVTNFSGQAWLEVDVNNDGIFSPTEQDFGTAVITASSSAVILQALPAGTYQIRALVRSVTGATVTTPTVTVTLDPGAGVIASQPLLQMLTATKDITNPAGTLPTDFVNANPLLVFNNQQHTVEINVHSTLPQYVNSLNASLVEAGMQDDSVDAAQDMITGFYPISKVAALPTIANFRDVTPVYKPLVYGATEFQGSAVIWAPAFISTTGANGAGEKVGVLSDSVNEAGSGIAGSIADGTLPPQGIQVLEDLPAGDGTATDEGRAMSEIVYNAAPGASLAFHTGGVSPQNMASGIAELASVGSTVICDDIGYPDEPMFNDGVIAQAVNQVAGEGVFYDSAAGNAGNVGFIGAWSGIQATVGGISGTYERFGNSALENVTLAPGADLTLDAQWNDAFLEGGDPADPNYRVKTEIDVIITSSNGTTLIGELNSNTLNTNEAIQLGDITNPSTTSSVTYSLSFLLKQGPAPTALRWVNFGDFFPGQITVSTGPAPTLFGHPAAQGAVAVGAVPYTTPTVSENFSSLGGALPFYFNEQGVPLPTPQIRDKPNLSGPDGVNTDFPGNTGLNPFFGTSAATPHVAAAAALLLEQSHGTAAEVIAHLEQTTTEVNGTTSFNGVSGFGLIHLTKLTVTPGGGPGTGTVSNPYAPNYTSDTAANLGTLAPGTQTLDNLPIQNLPDGLPEYAWYRYTTTTAGTLTLNMTFTSAGTLDLLLFTVDSNNTLIQLGAGVNAGNGTGGTQQVAVAVPPNEPILIEVFGYDFSQGVYNLTVQLQ